MSPKQPDLPLPPGTPHQPMVLELSTDRPGRLTVRPIRVRREDYGAHFALAGALRQCPKWRGPGAIQVVVERPDILERALKGLTAIPDARALEGAAGISWFLPAEFRTGVTHLQEWLARVKDHLTALLRKRSARRRPANR